jgi:muconolactone delta-isomerase
MECLDREQRELSSSGVTRRVVPASLTAEERARAQAQAEAEAAQRSREMDQKRRDRALLARYPNQKLHDAEREKQLAQLLGTRSVIEQRRAELRQQQQGLQDEMQFYRNDPSKAPAWLKHRVADNAGQLATQEKLLANHAEEQQRLHARFDEELQRLQQLWRATGSGSAAVAR